MPVQMTSLPSIASRVQVFSEKTVQQLNVSKAAYGKESRNILYGHIPMDTV